MTDGVRMEEISPSKSVLPRPTLTATPPLSPLSSSPATPSPEPAQIISTSSTLFTTSASPYPSLPILPWAAVFAIVIALFLTLVAGLLILRKLLKSKGIYWSRWLPECPGCAQEEGFWSCKERCLLVAEAMDCSIPSCQVWFDNACPTKQQCGATCSKVWSCYCCLLLSGECQDIQFCPNCSALECPDCDCCGDCCHCTLKPPECSQVTCLCFECGRPSTNS